MPVSRAQPPSCALRRPAQNQEFLFPRPLGGVRFLDPDGAHRTPGIGAGDRKAEGAPQVLRVEVRGTALP